jgi:hypothetical protein
VRGEAGHAHSFEEVEAGAEGGDGQEVRGAVFEGFVAGAEAVGVGGHGRIEHGSAREPGALQPGQGVAAGDERA